MKATTERTPTLRQSTIFHWFGALQLAVGMFAVGACSHKPAPVTENVAPQPAAPANAPAASPATAPAPAPVPEPSRAVQAQMRNVLFHLSSTAAAHIDTLTGEVVPTGNNAMPVLDDKTSFEVRVKSARISVSPEALADTIVHLPKPEGARAWALICRGRTCLPPISDPEQLLAELQVQV